MDLDTRAQCSAISSIIGYYCHTAIKYRLPVKRAVSFLNSFLMPKIEMGLRFAQPRANQTKAWDAQIGSALSNLIGSPRVLKSEALAVAFGVTLPSSLEKITKISEAFIRLNSAPSLNVHCVRARWNSSSFGGRFSRTSRLVRCVALATDCGIQLERCPEVKRLGSCHDFLPVYGSRFHTTLNFQPLTIVLGSRCLWGVCMPQRSVTVWSAASSPNLIVDPNNDESSGWGLCIETDKLLAVSSVLPERAADRDSVLSSVLGFGDKIDPFVPGGVYTCRLIAVIHAILAVPASGISCFCPQGAIDALHWFSLCPTDHVVSSKLAVDLSSACCNRLFLHGVRLVDQQTLFASFLMELPWLMLLACIVPK